MPRGGATAYGSRFVCLLPAYPYSKCCACNIHVTGDSMHVVTLHACSSNVTCTVLLHACWIHVSYTCNTHVT